MQAAVQEATLRSVALHLLFSEFSLHLYDIFLVYTDKLKSLVLSKYQKHEQVSWLCKHSYLQLLRLAVQRLRRQRTVAVQNTSRIQVSGWYFYYAYMWYAERVVRCVLVM